MLVTYILGTITALFIDKIPNKYIFLQNLIIGIISGIICFFLKLDNNIFHVLIVCIMSSMSASGLAQLLKIKDETNNIG